MSPEPRDVADLFEAALGYDGAGRREFLDRACAGDPVLRAEVDDLLQWHQRAEDGSGALPPASAAARAASALVRAASLASGRFGPFCVDSKLGEGSTAIVYRALDTRSNRVVALKVGSARTILDPASQRRFEQAAAATTNLEHPHIARVLDRGVEQDVPWLSLEFVDGRTLGDLLGPRGGLRGGRLDLATALKLGRQVSEALAAAHEQGIVHRDLKPANIMIERDGGAKVLDFGLCHAIRGRETIAGTQSGFLLGTPGYMAPELARGMKPDPASDIFSLGAVFYEMLTGTPAFRGETTVATLSCVLHESPPPMRGVPAPIQALVERCLEKEPSRRPASAAQVAAAIARLEQGLAAGRVRIRPGWDGLRSRVRRMPRRAAFGVAAIALALGAVAAGSYGLRRGAQAPVARQITLDQSTLNTEPAVSPDGKWIAFASDRSGEGNLDLWMVSTAGSAAQRQMRRLTRNEINIRQPEFSPDGRTVLFRSDRDGGGIFRIRVDSAAGPAPASMVAPHGLHPRFSPDGKRLAYWVGLDTSGDVLAPGASKVYVLDGAWEKPRQVCPEFVSAAYPVWSPDGQSILFAGHRRFPDEYRDPFVWMTAADVCSPVAAAKPWDFPNSKLPAAIIPQRWLPGNRLLFRTADVDGSNPLIELQVTQVPGESTMRPEHLISPVNLAALAGESGLAYAQVRNEANLFSMPLGAPAGSGSALEPMVACGSLYCIPALSPDGAVLFFSRARGVGWEFVRRDLKGRAEKVVAPVGPSSPWPFAIGPQHDLFFSRLTGENVFDANRVSGKTSAETIVCPDCPELCDVSLSGRFLLGSSGQGRRTIALIDTQTQRRRELLGHPQWNLYRASFSPDEHSILFTAKIAPDRSVVFVTDFSGTEGGPPESWVAVSDDNEYNGPAHWSPAGDRIYFTSQRDGHRCLYMREWDRARHIPAGPITLVRHFHAEGESPGLIPQSLFGFAVANDRIVIEIGRRIGNIWLMN